MNDKVVTLNTVTRLDIPVERVIGGIPEDMQSIVVCGYDADGEFYFSSSQADGGDVLWALETAKRRLLAYGDSN